MPSKKNTAENESSIQTTKDFGTEKKTKERGGRCPGGEKPSEPFRREKDVNDSNPIIVWGYEGNTMVYFFLTDDQWQKTKSVIFDVQVKNINDNCRKRKMKITT